MTRVSFFEESTWAVQGSGISRKGNATFCRRMTECGFPWYDFAAFAVWPPATRNQFFDRLYPQGISGRGRMRLAAVGAVARLLVDLESDVAFQAEVFVGKARSADLNRDDVRRLRVRRLPELSRSNSLFL
jgi:hypothetical protein